MMQRMFWPRSSFLKIEGEMKREGKVGKEKHKTMLFQRELTELNEFEITRQN